ncbi:hypothetical protein Asulf_00530 [Archaeoglobus sulfaticallidus PM70-1]|uniref:N-methylhydantoinase A/acetone carboxylase, beta subunit n=1 Tax=Archaeoglobus sulfaticallidus PM70-1 TaxID=387631 RepID=N0BJB9_9EURY|nr:hydantoinase/oxoprolinase family protein [Archaeoglobus sulfaticallidus]AGK60551.1 hypothetical protein Asulf_00530 [Archaeoglobus sulfaticallidus PM70-1]
MFIGIDVGGTNTDIAIIKDNEIKTIKIPNEEGFEGAFRRIPAEDIEKSRIAVSTSLPLNLLLSRSEQYPTLSIVVPGPGLNYEKFGKVVRGFVNHRGDVVEDIDEREIEEILKSSEYDNIAISSKFSVRNASIENKIFEIARKYCDERSIALSHYGGGMIFPYRINTAIINAKIIKTVYELTDTIKSLVGDFFYYKGDGGIIPYQIALRNPSELYNSSPAAVAVGAYFLTKERKALVIDIGGTTTDFVLIEDGLPKIVENIEFFGRKTLIRCVDSFSIPFGGDSAVENGKLKPGRIGKPIAFGGENFTLTDALNLEDSEIGDYRKSIEYAESHGIDSRAIDSFVEMIAKSIESMEAERIILTGYLSRYLAKRISRASKVSVIVPDHSESVNAVGVAVSRISLTMYVRYDTESGKAIYNGVVESCPFKLGSLPSDEEMMAYAEQKLIDVIKEQGYDVDEKVNVIYFNSYSVVRGGIKRGKIADIVVQIQPGISKELLW